MWMQNRHTNSYRDLPHIISWGSWIAQNNAIFKYVSCNPVVTTANVVGILAHFAQLKEGLLPCNIRDLEVDKLNPWGFFDVSSLDNPP